MLIRDNAMWTVAAQGTSPAGARVVLHRTRLSTRFELTVGAAIVGSYAGGESGRAYGDWSRACGAVGSRRAA